MRYRLVGLACLLGASALAQPANPVTWNVTVEPARAPTGASVQIRLAAKLESGWHIYSLTTPEGGPTPTSLRLTANPIASQLKVYQPKPATRFDNTFKVNTEIFEGAV